GSVLRWWRGPWSVLLRLVVATISGALGTVDGVLPRGERGVLDRVLEARDLGDLLLGVRDGGGQRASALQVLDDVQHRDEGDEHTGQRQDQVGLSDGARQCGELLAPGVLRREEAAID